MMTTTKIEAALAPRYMTRKELLRASANPRGINPTVIGLDGRTIGIVDSIGMATVEVHCYSDGAVRTFPITGTRFCAL